MEESEAETEEGKAAGDVRKIKLQHGGEGQSVFQVGGCWFCFWLLLLFFVDCVEFTASSSISFFSQEVQTAGARFTKHWPELLEHVVGRQQ